MTNKVLVAPSKSVIFFISTAYSGETKTITLPEGKTLDDFTGISVWCVQFGADFGNVEYLPPQANL